MLSAIPSKRLQEALKEYSRKASNPVHTGGSSSITPPALRIQGLSTPVKFPLQEKQAKQLAKLAKQSPHGQGLRTVIDPTVRDCLQIEPDNIEFSNQQWKRSLQNLVNRCVRYLGISPKSVQHQLYKLLLYRKGGHFRAHTDTEKLPGMFATMIIQLPSKFQGGQLIIRHQGEEKKYSGGADDASCKDKLYYTAFFADVEHELRPITQGYRIALVYNLVWTAQGPEPVLSGHGIKQVADALHEHAEQAPCQAWMLAIPSHHQYTMASLQKFGVRSLKSQDASNVAALCKASESIGIGKLEVVLCLLIRRDEEFSREGDAFDAYETTPRLWKAYNADGAGFREELYFVDWGSASEGSAFVMKNQTKVRYTGNEGARRETMYTTVVTLMWPAGKRFEVLSPGTRHFERVLREGPISGRTARIDRMLSWLEALPENILTSRKASIILKHCAECGLTRQAPRVLKLPLKFTRDPRIRESAVALVSRFGWKLFGSMLEDFLCPSECRKLEHMESPLMMLHDLGESVPREARFRSLETMLDFLGQQRDIFNEKRDLEEPHWKRVDRFPTEELYPRLWETLLVCVAMASVELDATVKQKTEELVSKIDSVLSELDEPHLTSISERLKEWKPTADLSLARRLQRKVRSCAYDRQLERFMSDAEYIVSNHRVRPPKNAQPGFGYSYGCITRGEDFRSFISLAFRVMSHDVVAEETSELYFKFVSTIPSLSEVAIESIAESVEDLQAETKSVFPFILGTVMYAKDQRKADRLRKRVDKIVEETANEVQDFRRTYEDISTGISKVDRFLRSRRIAIYIRVKDQEAGRKMHGSLQRLLPEGFQSDLELDEGGAWTISVTKPFEEEHRARVEYEWSVRELARVRKELKVIEKRKRRLPDADAYESLAKRAKRSDLQVIWKVLKM